VAAAFGVATVAASFLPVKAGVGVGYYAMVPVDLIILYAAYLIVRDQGRETAHRSQILLKTSIFLAVLAFLVAALV
jgi:geranylgeranylglycerol-phosphate geranylgeranyltransferase